MLTNNRIFRLTTNYQYKAQQKIIKSRVRIKHFSIVGFTQVRTHSDFCWTRNRTRTLTYWTRTRTLVQWTPTRTGTLVQWTRTHTWWTPTLAWWTGTQTLALWTRTHCWTHESGLTPTLHDTRVSTGACYTKALIQINADHKWSP